MKKKITLLLLVCLAAINAFASSTKDAIETLNRNLPLDSGTERVLGKIIYDEINNLVVANYLTTWQNLVQMRKTPDFENKAGNDVLNLIYVVDPQVRPFTLVVNYFADESGFEDLSKTYIFSPGQIGSGLKSLSQKGNNKKDQNNSAKQQTALSEQQAAASTQAQVKDPLDILALRLADFKGYTDSKGNFQIAKYSLSKDRKDINVVVIAKDEVLPYFTEDKYASSMQSAMNSRLAKNYPDLEPIFNNMGLNVAIFVADTQGDIKAQHKYPASNVFAQPKSDNAKGKSTQASQTSANSSQQSVAQQPASAQPLPTGENPQQPASQQKTNKSGTPEKNFQALVKLNQALLPKAIAQGLKITKLEANKDALVLLVDVDAEKYPEDIAPKLRELLMMHLVAEFGKQKSVYPLMINLCCQTSRQYIYVLSSKDWSKTYPVPLDPCSVLESLRNQKAQADK